MLTKLPALALLITVSLCAAQETNSPKQLFVERCAVCHGADAGGSDRGPSLAGNRRLRTRSASDIINIIRNGTPGGMPAIPLPEDQVSTLVDYVRSLNANAFDIKPQGDAAAGERLFFGPGNCSSCHTAAITLSACKRPCKPYPDTKNSDCADHPPGATSACDCFGAVKQ